MEIPSQSTYLMEFHADSQKLSDVDGIITTIVELLERFIGGTQQVFRKTSEGTTTVVFELCKHAITTVQIKSSGLILLNIDVSSDENLSFNYQVSKDFEKELKQKLSVVKSAAIVPIRRGGSHNALRYLISSDERILEYDVDYVVADIQSKFQRIQIMHTINYGNLLVLDELQNLAESDLIYTETLMQRGKIDYTDKDVLILGAGDGALLCELLKENPRMVTMVEIDEDVMKLCRQHLRSACGSALDSYVGPNHRILVSDCLLEMDKFVEDGTKFDFIFGDLTDVPLSLTPQKQNKEWQFLQSVLGKSLGLLKPNGKFLTHGAGAASVQSLDLLESHFRSLEPAVKFTRCQMFIPSFMESWVFYQLERNTEE